VKHTSRVAGAADKPVPRAWIDTALAWYFVVVWGSGFIATKIALQFAAPFTLLTLRYALGILCLGALALVVKVRWPQGPRAWLHAVVAGLLVHAVNLGGSHYAQFLGLSAGTTALVLAAQPLLTALVASPLLHESLHARQWLGVVMGLGGVALVVANKIDVHQMSTASLVAVAVSLVGSTAGMLYQRRFCAFSDLRAVSLIQFAASFVVLAPLAWVVEGFAIRWTWALVGATAFLVIAASILALNAFHLLMRRGQATRVSSLMYLPPVVAALLEFALFGVIPSIAAFVGTAVVCAGVALVASRSRSRARQQRLG